MSNPYSDNPFDSIYAAPSPVAQASGKPQQATPAQAAALDDLINPFAVLGMENKSAKSPTAASYPQASGAGYMSPHASPSYAASPARSPVQQQYPAQALAAPQVYAPPQQQWAASPNSAFQPPPQIVTSQAYSPSVSPAFSGSSPSSAYGAPSPAYGTYSPASPAFGSGYPVSSSPSGSPFGGSGHGKQPTVTDADLNLFTSPVVAVKPTPKPTVVAAPATVAPQQQQQAPASAAPATTQGGWAPTVSPKANDGWDNDDFGISWEAPKKAAPAVQEAAVSSPSSSSPQRTATREEDGAYSSSSPKKNSAGAVDSPKRGPAVSATEAAIAADHKTEGNVLARISVRTLIVKEWRETFWIINNGKLLLYRSKEDYLYNPVGVMVKKDIPLRDNLRCSEVTCKPYKGYGDLYHFTLEEMLDYGPSLIAKFASQDVKAIRELRAVVIAYIIAERKKRVGGQRRTTPTNSGAEEHRHQSSSPRQASPRQASPVAQRPVESNAPANLDKYEKWGKLT